MSICKKYTMCENYDLSSETCRDDGSATGYCGIRKKLADAEKQENHPTRFGAIMNLMERKLAGNPHNIF